MRLLFDSNISHRLKEPLGEMYPESIRVREIGLESAADVVVWTYAKDHEFTIVSKDSDFRQMSFTFGHPPKVIWIRRGNCSTSEIDSILRDRYDDMIAFYEEEQSAFLALS